MSRLRAIWHNPFTRPIYLPSLLLALGQGILVPVMPLFAASFDISYGLIGLVLSGYYLGTLLTDIPVGIILAQIGTRRTLLIGLLLVSLPLGLIYFTQTVWALFIFYTLAGFGAALSNISRHRYLTEAVKSGARGRAIALFGGLNRIGRFSGPAIGGFLGATFGLRLPFLLVAALGGLALLLVYWFLPRGEETAVAAPPRLRGHLQSVTGVIGTHRPVLGPAGSGMLLAQTIRAGRQAIIPLFGADVLGLDVQAIGVIETAAAAVDMSLFYPVGIVMDRWGRKFAIVPSFLVQGVGMALLPLAGSFSGLLVITCLIGFGNGLGSGTMMTLGSDLSPAHARGEFLGVWRFIGDIGFTVGPIVVGGIADLLRLQNAAVALAGIGALSAFIFARFVPETLRKETHPDDKSR